MEAVCPFPLLEIFSDPHNLKINVLNAMSSLSNNLSVCILLAKSPLQI